ncbi:MAG: hypothetical protein WCI26_12350 [Acidimicrobiales bacterium]
MTNNSSRGWWQLGRSARFVPAVAVLGLSMLAGCGSNLLGTSSSTGGPSADGTASESPSTTVPVNGEVAVAFPVVACTDPANGGTPIKATSGWNPTILLAPVPTSLVGKVAFYTDGVHTVLGPSGWTCAHVGPGSSSSPGTSGTSGQTSPGGQGSNGASSATPSWGQDAAIGASGTTTLAVFPPNDPNPPTSGPPAPGTEGIFATFATTATNAGIQLVCPYFTLPPWQTQSAGCSTPKPTGETTNVLTPDVTEITDPAGLVGSLAASGGQGPTSGVVLFPQIPSAISNGTPIAVAMESCALTAATLCATILSDFDVREFPVPVSR